MAKRSTRTSRAALAAIRPFADTLRIIAFQAIHSAGDHGMTALEVVDASGRERWSIAPRISELVSDKAVINSGRTRTNPSGKEAIVWIVAPQPEAGQ
jgi:hypothetical protein